MSEISLQTKPVNQDFLTWYPQIDFRMFFEPFEIEGKIACVCVCVCT